MNIFLHGTDTYSISKKIQEIKQKYLNDVENGSTNISILNGEVCKIENLRQELTSAPFLARKKLLILKDLLNKSNNTDILLELEKLIKKESDESIIVIVETDKPKKNQQKSKIFNKLLKLDYIWEFSPMNSNDLKKWAINELKIANKSISNQALNQLLASTGNDLWLLSNELNKLANFSNKDEISIEDIEKLCINSYDDDIWKLIDSIANKNKKQGIKLISDQINNGANEIQLFNLIVRQFKILLKVSEKLSNNQYNTHDIAKILKLHPYVAKKSVEQSKNFTLDQLKVILKHLLLIDIKIKSNNLTPKLLFELFIVKI